MEQVPLPRVAIVILNWNGWHDTLACLASVKSSALIAATVLVVDNGSSNESVAQIRNWIDLVEKSQTHIQFEMCALDQNYGFAEGCNRGLERVQSGQFDYYLLLNNDASVEPQTIAEMVRVSRAMSADLVGAHIFTENRDQSLYEGRSWPGHLFGLGHMRQDPSLEAWPTDQVDGCCFLMTSRFLETRKREMGYVFDPDLFLYCEDLDLAVYGKHRGFKAMVAARARVFHGLSKSSGGPGNPRSFYYISRNRIYLAKRWLSGSMRAVFHIYYLLSRAVLILKYRLQGRKLVSRAIWAGVWDGYLGIRGPMREDRI